MNDSPDPRIYLAAERTLLAWVRTGLTVLGLGFVVARFGLFLRIIRQNTAPQEPLSTSVILGIGFILFGAAAMAIAGWRHLQFSRTLPPEARAVSHGWRWPVVFTFVLAFCGLLLAGYLLRGSTAPN